MFVNPGNGHQYVILAPDAFSRFVCEWIGAVQDCIIIYWRGYNDVSKKFAKDDALDVVYASDEECEEMESVFMYNQKLALRGQWKRWKAGIRIFIL